MATIDLKSQEPLLLVEDEDNDVLLLRRAFVKAGILNPIHAVSSAEGALAYLAGEGVYADRLKYPLPTLVLLDLKLPGKDGFEVLEWIRRHPTLSALRVIVLTSSTRARDSDRAHQLRANSYLIKPVEFDHLVALSSTLGNYWLRMNEAPQL